MPIKPPELDPRRYADIVREARTLIPQYCPEWTNLGDADPGMTMVQLFAWMTEMTIHRLNKVPDRTFVHFLNFIGEERRSAKPAEVLLSYQMRGDEPSSVEVASFSIASTKQQEGVDAIHYVTTQPVTVHGAAVERMVAVIAQKNPIVREIPFVPHSSCSHAITLGEGGGVWLFDVDPIEHGGRCYTPEHYLYLAHDDLRLMEDANVEPARAGRLRIRSASDEELPIGALFIWEYYTGVKGSEWAPVVSQLEDEEVLGLPEVTLQASLAGASEVDHFGLVSDPMPVPEVFEGEPRWIRGKVDYERWLAHRMQSDLEIYWSDDRGGEDRSLNNWDVRATGRAVEFFVQDMPPIRAGWTVRLTLVDRGMAAGNNSYLPKYRWSYRFGERWETIPSERVRHQETSVVLTGPFNDMANDGYNIRAERVESINFEAFIPKLGLRMDWLRPVEVNLAAGPESASAALLDMAELPTSPFQPVSTLAPMVGLKMFVGTDLLANRAQKKVTIELEVGFTQESELVEEPSDKYKLQLTYRSADTWRVVHSKSGIYDSFTFADIDPDGATYPERRVISIEIDPTTQLRSLQNVALGGVDTTWLRLELTKADMSVAKDKKKPPIPLSLHIYNVRVGLEGDLDSKNYEQPLPGVKVASVEHRANNRRLSRVVSRSSGALSELFPFDQYIDLDDEEGSHHALYMKLDKPLPMGNRHAIHFRMRGESFLPDDLEVTWELLEDSGNGAYGWHRLEAIEDTDGKFKLQRTGVLQFGYADPVTPHQDGAWIRALIHPPDGEDLPKLPPLSHVMLNTVTGVNVHPARMEKFSGLAIPHQVIQLRKYPLFLHDDSGQDGYLLHPDMFTDIKVIVDEDGARKEWRRAPGNSLLDSSKDDRVFVIDPVQGSLKFGNGIRGKMLPVGNYNVMVEVYHTVPGEAGNIGAGDVIVAQGYGDLLTVTNLLPATGGRNAESIEQIIRRAPNILTARDRAVTRGDFEVVARQASGEVSRAACNGKMGEDGEVEVVVLPQRGPNDVIPDRFLSAGLKELVCKYLSARCLVNVQPVVRLATFKPIDVLVTVRLRPNSDTIIVRERANVWVKRFLDPYDGGLDGEGWPFQGTLYAQDFGRLVTDISEIRHVAEVQLFDVGSDQESTSPGWESGQGVEVSSLDAHDLFVVRHVRVQVEGES